MSVCVCFCVWAQCRGALHRGMGGGRGGGAGAAAGPLGARSTVCHLRSSRHTWKSHGHVKWKCSSSAPNNNSPSPALRSSPLPVPLPPQCCPATGIGSQLVSVSSACAACCTDMYTDTHSCTQHTQHTLSRHPQTQTVSIRNGAQAAGNTRQYFA